MRNRPDGGPAWLMGLVVSTALSAIGLAAAPGSPAEAAPMPARAAPLSLADLEQMALHGNPTLAQAAAQVEAARGRAVQAGLYPNPTVGYEADRIGAAGSAGEMQGAF